MRTVFAMLMLVAQLAVGTVPAAGAQAVTGTVHGRVADASGAAVPGASVTLAADAIGLRTSVTTDDAGEFVITNVRPGDYRLEVERTGFRRLVQQFTMPVNQDRRFAVTLEAGPVTETVTVVAPDEPFDRGAMGLTTRFGPDRVANLPLDGRNFLELALLAAGTSASAEGSAATVRGDFAFSASGGREDGNTYWLDGAYNFDPKLNTVAVRPPVDAIREFEVITSTPDASLGTSSGAHVNVVTKSGTNTFGGTAYEFLRTSAFNARNRFAPEDEPAPDYNRNQYGVSVGGPIRRDRVFFFADYEGTRLTEGITRVTNVPTLAERAGDFSDSPTGVPVNPFTGMPFDGGRIPPPFLNPVGLAIASLYPRPNRDAPFANFVSSPDLIDHADQFDLRLDYAGERSLVTTRYSFSDRRLFEPFAGSGFSLVPGFGTDVPRRAQNLLLSATQTVGARMVNEARAAWTRVSAGALHEGQGDSLSRQVGLPELSDDPRDWGLPLITVAGFSPLGDEFNNPQRSTTNMWQVSDTLTWTAGRHLVKAGAEVRALSQSAFRDVQSRGLMQFTNQAFTGNGLADLLLGLPTVTVGAAVDNPQELRATSVAAFMQDRLALSPTVTATLGLRYELNLPPVDARDRVTLYDPSTGAIVPVGVDGFPRAGFEADRNNVAPRLGLAWTPAPDSVVRGGYGIAYEQAALAPNEFLYFNPPYFDLNTYFTVPQAGYTLTLFDPFPADFPVPLPTSATAVQRDLRTGYQHQFNLGVQQELGDTRTLEVAYVGSRGRNLIAARDINQPAPSPVMPNLRPNPLFADILLIESRARSEYNALQVRLDQRLDRGHAFQTAYTLGKSMDDASGFFSSAGDANFPMDSNDPEAEWARSNFDVRHRLTLAGLWELPFGPDRRWFGDGLLGTCLGNWDMYAVFTGATGQPFTVAVHPDLDVSNTGRANLGFGSNDRPDLVGDPEAGGGTPEQWFNPAAFALPEFGTFGDVGRNSLEGPGYRNLNLAFTRVVGFSRGDLQVRLEVYNVFNWTNYGLPDKFLGSPTFGQILSAGAPRRFQVGVKWRY
jgi:hypothetical protein